MLIRLLAHCHGSVRTLVVESRNFSSGDLLVFRLDEDGVPGVEVEVETVPGGADAVVRELAGSVCQ